MVGAESLVILTNVDGEDNILQLVLPVRTYN